MLFVERLAVPGAVINYNRAAGRMSLHASCSGLLLLTHTPAEQQERVLGKPLEVYTDRTISTSTRLRIWLSPFRPESFRMLSESPGVAGKTYCRTGTTPSTPSARPMNWWRKAHLVWRNQQTGSLPSVRVKYSPRTAWEPISGAADRGASPMSRRH